MMTGVKHQLTSKYYTQLNKKTIMLKKSKRMHLFVTKLIFFCLYAIITTMLTFLSLTVYPPIAPMEANPTTSSSSAVGKKATIEAATPTMSSPPPPPPMGKKKVGGGGRGLPSPRDMIAHYESKGMDTQQASLKVIENLQNVIFKGILEKKKTNKVVGGTEDSISGNRKLDVINTRLVNMELKLDSKPGYPQTLAIGVASGAVFSGITAIIPHLASSVAHIWNSVRTSTSSP